MKVAIVGAGAAGITAAINYKRHNKSDDVLVIEHLDKPLKKILATGNGKCNLGNASLDYSKFNNCDFAKKIIGNYNYQDYFDSISIKTKLFDNLAYPVSESAVSVRDALLNETRKLDIKISCNDALLDYELGNKIKVSTTKGKYEVDKLVLAGGLCSSPKLGSDGSVLKLLKKHGYNYCEPQPGLSPLHTKEKTKTLDGVRAKCNVKLYANKNLIHEELGEVLFKDRGLSGIVIFNTMSIISRKPNFEYKIHLDLLPDYTIEYLENYCKNRTISEFLRAFLNPKISDYLVEKYGNESQILNSIKSLEFTFDSSYGFDFSQVTVGGINIQEVDENLMSKRERNVFIIGELLNIDGPCGGYNLTWAFASGMRIK